MSETLQGAKKDVLSAAGYVTGFAASAFTAAAVAGPLGKSIAVTTGIAMNSGILAGGSAALSTLVVASPLLVLGAAAWFLSKKTSNNFLKSAGKMVSMCLLKYSFGAW